MQFCIYTQIHITAMCPDKLQQARMPGNGNNPHPYACCWLLGYGSWHWALQRTERDCFIHHEFSTTPQYKQILWKHRRFVVNMGWLIRTEGLDKRTFKRIWVSGSRRYATGKVDAWAWEMPGTASVRTQASPRQNAACERSGANEKHYRLK